MRTQSRARSIAIWGTVAVIGAISWGVIALVRDEPISAAWLIAAAIGSYAIAYRFYARFIEYRVLGADRSRATPAERLENDRDFQPTDRRGGCGGPLPPGRPARAALRPPPGPPE